MMTQFLDLVQENPGEGNEDIPKLKVGFAHAYIALLQAIVDNDTKKLGKMCEHNMFSAFNEGMQDLNFQTKEIQLLNFDGDLDD